MKYFRRYIQSARISSFFRNKSRFRFRRSGEIISAIYLGEGEVELFIRINLTTGLRRVGGKSLFSNIRRAMATINIITMPTKANEHAEVLKKTSSPLEANRAEVEATHRENAELVRQQTEAMDDEEMKDVDSSQVDRILDSV